MKRVLVALFVAAVYDAALLPVFADASPTPLRSRGDLTLANSVPFSLSEIESMLDQMYASRAAARESADIEERRRAEERERQIEESREHYRRLHRRNVTRLFLLSLLAEELPTGGDGPDGRPLPLPSPSARLRP